MVRSKETQQKRGAASGAPTGSRKKLPDLYLCCGTEDFLIEPNRAMHRFLTDEQVPHEYHEGPGTHDMDFLSHWIVKVVRLIAGERDLS